MAMPPPVRGTSVGGGPEGSREEALCLREGGGAGREEAVVMEEAMGMGRDTAGGGGAGEGDVEDMMEARARSLASSTWPRPMPSPL